MNTLYNLAVLTLFAFFFAGDQALELQHSSPLPDCEQTAKREKAAVSNIAFKSADGGQTWQDISDGLPKPVQDNNGVTRDIYFTDANGLYLTAGNGIYHCKANAKLPVWSEEVFPYKNNSIAPGKAGIFAFNYQGEILQKAIGTGVWSPVFTDLRNERVRSIFETAGGAVFIGSDKGLFKSTNNGKTWKHVYAGGWAIKMVAYDGILLATSMKGIIRSIDDGENWTLVISEGGVGIDVAAINGGFAAITFNTQSNTRRIRTSYDGGKSWQPIDAGLQSKYVNDSRWQPGIAGLPGQGITDSVWNPGNNSLPVQAFITTIIEVGGNFFCGHPDGIYKSSDKGETWKLVFPSVKGKVFNLCVSGNVIYAIPVNGGC